MGQELFDVENLRNEDEMRITDYLRANQGCLLYLGLTYQKEYSENRIYGAILEPNPKQGHFIYGEPKIVSGSLKVKDGIESSGIVYKDVLDGLLEKISKGEQRDYTKEYVMPMRSGLDALIYSGLNLFIGAKEKELVIEAKLFCPNYGSTVIFSDQFEDLYEMDQFYKENPMEPNIVSDINEGLRLNKRIQESLGTQAFESSLFNPINSSMLSQEFLDGYCKEIRKLKDLGLTLEGKNAIFTSRLLSRVYGTGK